MNLPLISIWLILGAPSAIDWPQPNPGYTAHLAATHGELVIMPEPSMAACRLDAEKMELRHY